MTEIDVIILSYTKNKQAYEMTKNCLVSLRDSEHSFDFRFNPILVETNSNYKEEGYTYECHVVAPKIPFNYNKFLNIGLREGKAEYVIVCNNDIIFHGNFITNIMEEFKKDKELMSACPRTLKWHRHTEEIFPDAKPTKTINGKNALYGYRTSYEVTGWCIVLRRSLLNIIGAFDEQFDFYYQDNDFAALLEKYKIKHALVWNSLITHLLSQTHYIASPQEIAPLADMNGQGNKFQRKWHTPSNVMPFKKLSILICSLEKRKDFLQALADSLKPQLTPEVEVLVSVDNGELTIGAKRNGLINSANGKYICFVDDDDKIADNYIKLILKALDREPDCAGFNLEITWDGKNAKKVIISSKYDKWSDNRKSPTDTDSITEYYRCPNHLLPVKKTIAQQVMFPNISDQEDLVYSMGISKLIKSEVFIDSFLYSYNVRSNK